MSEEIMTLRDIVKLLDGINYVDMFSEENAHMLTAEKNGIVVVSGASDDLMEFSGAINDEVDVYDGGIVGVTKDGLVDGGAEIEAVWCAEEAPWTYKTEIPHEQFNVVEDGGGLLCGNCVLPEGCVTYGCKKV